LFLRKRRRERRRKLRRALLLDRALRQELALEGARDLLLGSALRRLRDSKRYRRLGFARWSDYVAERLGCELRWAQYLVSLDIVLDHYPDLRQAVLSGLLTPLKVIHVSRLLTPETSEAQRKALIAAAARLSVRELEAQVRETLTEDRARTTLAHLEEEAVVPNPWDEGPGIWLSFQAPPHAITLFEAAVEGARRLTGENLPRHVCLEFMVADRFSAIGWSPELDRGCADDDRVRSFQRRREEERARVALAAREDEETSVPKVPTRLTTRAANRHRRSQRDAEHLARTALPPELEPDATSNPRLLDRMVQALEAIDRELRPILGELLTTAEREGSHALLGWPDWRAYCKESLGLDPRRASRLIAFRAGLDRFQPFEEAYGAGKLRYLQVVQLLRVAVPETASVWAEWAAGASVRRTREVTNEAWLLQITGTTFAPLDAGDSNLPPGAVLPPPIGTRRPVMPGLESGATPLLRPPAHPFRLFLPGDLTDFVVAGLRSCQDDRGFPLLEGDALAVLANGFLENMDDPEIERMRRDFPIFERDGWMCSVPFCTSRAYIHPHHVWFRGRGGPDAEWNLTSLCFLHHLEQLHGPDAVIAVWGLAPDALEWRIGLQADGPPLLAFSGDRRIPVEFCTTRGAKAPDSERATLRPASRPVAATGTRAAASAHPAAPLQYAH
jgi:hypothetical protein